MTALERWAHAGRTAIAIIVITVILGFALFETAKFFFVVGYEYKECSQDIKTYGPAEEYSWLIAD